MNIEPAETLLPPRDSGSSSLSSEPSVDSAYLARELDRSSSGSDHRASDSDKEIEAKKGSTSATMGGPRSLLSCTIWAALARAADATTSDTAAADADVQTAITYWAYTPFWSQLPKPPDANPGESTTLASLAAGVDGIEDECDASHDDAFERCGTLTPLPTEVILRMLAFVDVRMLTQTCLLPTVCKRFAGLCAGTWVDITPSKWQTIPLHASDRASRQPAVGARSNAAQDPKVLSLLNRRCFEEITIQSSTTPSSLHPLVLTEGGYEVVPVKWQYSFGTGDRAPPPPWMPSDTLVDGAAVRKLLVTRRRVLTPKQLTSSTKKSPSQPAGVRRIQTIEEMLANAEARIKTQSATSAPPPKPAPKAFVPTWRGRSTSDFWVERWVEAALQKRIEMDRWLRDGIVPFIVSAPARLVSGEHHHPLTTSSASSAVPVVTTNDGTVFTAVFPHPNTTDDDKGLGRDMLSDPTNVRMLPSSLRLSTPVGECGCWDAQLYEAGVLNPPTDQLLPAEIRGYFMHFGEGLSHQQRLLVPGPHMRPLIEAVGPGGRDARGRRIIENALLGSGCEDTPRSTMMTGDDEESLDLTLGNHTVLLPHHTNLPTTRTPSDGTSLLSSSVAPLYGMGYQHPYFQAYIANVSLQTKFHLSGLSLINHPQSIRHELESLISNFEVGQRIGLYGVESVLVREVSLQMVAEVISDRFLQPAQPLPALLHADPTMITGYVPPLEGAEDVEGVHGDKSSQGSDIVAVTTHHRTPLITPILSAANTNTTSSAAAVAGPWWEGRLEAALMFPVWVSKAIVTSVASEVQTTLGVMAREHIMEVSASAGEEGSDVAVDFAAVHGGLLGRLMSITAPFIVTNPNPTSTTLSGVTRTTKDGHRRRAAVLLERFLLLDAIIQRETSTSPSDSDVAALSSYTYQAASLVPPHLLRNTTPPMDILPMFPLPHMKLYQSLMASITFTDVNLHSAEASRQTAIYSRITSPFGPSTVELRSFISQMDSSHPRVLFKVIYSRVGGIPFEPAPATTISSTTKNKKSRYSDSEDDAEDGKSEQSFLSHHHTHPHHPCGSFYPSCGHSALIRDNDSNVNTECELIVGGFGRVEVDIAPKVFTTGYREVAKQLHLPAGFPLELLHNVFMAATGCAGWLNLLAPMYVGSFGGFTEGFDAAFSKEDIS